MAFVKLDCGILNSTLWVEREPRDVFITALLMAEPFEVIDPMPQYKIGAIELTGFVVPPGWYGFVRAAGPGIVRMAMAGYDEGMAALDKLGSPDLDSRSSDFDGRRLVRVDGGFIVLNFMKYRDRDNTGAVRAARYREKKRREAADAVTRDISTVTRDSSCGVTKQKQKQKQSINTLGPDHHASYDVVGAIAASASTPPSPPPEFLGDENMKAFNGKTVCQLSELFELPTAWGEDAENLGFQSGRILLEAEKYRQYWVQGKGAGTRKSVKGWRQSWSNWLGKAAQ